MGLLIQKGGSSVLPDAYYLSIMKKHLIEFSKGNSGLSGFPAHLANVIQNMYKN